MNVEFDDGHKDQIAILFDPMTKNELIRRRAVKLLGELLNNGFTDIAVQYLDEFKQSLNKKG